jgi:prefoldin beta subunit
MLLSIFVVSKEEMNMENIPQKLQNQLAMLQQMQQQLQTVITQKAQYDMTIREARRALEDLADVPEDAAVFMNVGSVMMQKSKEKVVAALNERIETLELRVKSLEKQEKALQQRYEQLSSQVRDALEGKQKPPGPA